LGHMLGQLLERRILAIIWGKWGVFCRVFLVAVNLR